jgi:hypothetical protein
VHDDEDPEYSILKQRMVNKMKEEGTVVDESFSLTEITKIAERTITAVSGCLCPAMHASEELLACWPVGMLCVLAVTSQRMLPVTLLCTLDAQGLPCISIYNLHVPGP